MERLARVDLPDLLDLLVREASKVNPDLQVSRVFPDLQAHLEREASLASPVFLERVELLVPSDPEENVDSLVREAVRDPRVFRDPVDFQGHQELMDQRELLDQPVPRAARDPQACRACPERGERVASPDPRVTEVTMERKDWKDLLAKMEQEV